MRVGRSASGAGERPACLEAGEDEAVDVVAGPVIGGEFGGRGVGQGLEGPEGAVFVGEGGAGDAGSDSL